MKYIILGQPRSGKSTLAKLLSNELGIPIICTDMYRRIWGFHEPWKGYSTEISPINQKRFYDRLLELYNDYDDVILEGSAINPNDIDLFPNDGVVLLYRTLSAEEKLRECRKYDTDWTSRRDDKYLLELFVEYNKFSEEWVENNKEISINTNDFFAGIDAAKNKLLNFKRL